MSAFVVSRRATAVAAVMVVAAGGVAVAAGSPAGRTATRATVPPKLISIVPQGAWASDMTSSGPSLSATGNDSMRVGFVVPPDRAGTKKPAMRVVYLESSPTMCTWSVSTSGLEGPDGPDSESNVHNGAWQLPGTTAYSGLVKVKAGAGSAHTAIFRWPFDANPGMFVQFALNRNGADPADTCGSVTVVGMELAY